MSDKATSGPAGITSKRDLKPLCEVMDAETGAVKRTTFAFVDEHDTVWFGQAQGVSKFDLTIEDAKQLLRRVEDECVYPELIPGITVITDEERAKSNIYIKRPKLHCLDDEEETRLLPRMLLEEGQVLESLRPHGHKNLVRYHGYVSRRGRIVGIALERHDALLQYRFHDDPRELDIEACMDGLRAGIEHLHSLGHAHNDLNPMNIALDDDDQPVILDFGSCRRFGESL